MDRLDGPYHINQIYRAPIPNMAGTRGLPWKRSRKRGYSQSMYMRIAIYVTYSVTTAICRVSWHEYRMLIKNL